jgi:hypothetical protein
MSTGKAFAVKTKNCIKIAMLIERSMGKSEFEKGELEGVFAYVVKNYKSELKPADYKQIVEVMGEFVRTGGRVDFE